MSQEGTGNDNYFSMTPAEAYNLDWRRGFLIYNSSDPWSIIPAGSKDLFQHSALERMATSMEPPRYVHQYGELFKWQRRCGFSTPWLEKPYFYFRFLDLAYDTITICMVLYILLDYSYTVLTTSMSFQDLCLFGIGFGSSACSMFITCYQILYSYRLKEMTDRMDLIGQKIMQSDLGGKEFFKKEYAKNARFLSIFTRCSMTSIFTTPFSYFLSVPVMEWFEGNYREHLPLPLANVFDDRQPVVYEIVVIVLSAGISIATAKKAALDSLFISFFSIQSTILKYLSVAKEEMSKEPRFADDERSHRRLLTWVKLHQEIIENIEELVKYFSPLVIVYYIAVVEIVVCGAFVELKKDNDNIVQSVSVGSYVMLTVIFYYLLSNKADELTSEVQNMGLAEYNLPWYAMKKNDVSITKIILMMSNKPIHITAYKAPAFCLNRETFSQFIVRAISALVTLFQMKDRFG